MINFQTPCGEITIQDENGNAVEFYIRRKEKKESWLFYGSDHAYPIQTNDVYEIYIPKNHLNIGKNYQLQIHDCPCEFGGSDEDTICNYAFQNNYHLSIGAVNPNNNELYHWIFQPYSIHFLCDYSGYVFRILGGSFDQFDEIVFPIAWIEHFTKRPAILRFVEEEDLIQQFFSYITCLTT